MRDATGIPADPGAETWQARVLIVNADDFGRSAATNAGIIRAHERGIVTSASLMVRQPGAEAAAGHAREHPALSIGLHLDLSPWSRRDADGRVISAHRDPAREVAAQLERFRALLGRAPTHLDSHHHVHRQEPVGEALAAAAQRLGVPLRERSPITYCESFYGQSGQGRPRPAAISVDGLLGIIGRLPRGITELGCHPGLDEALASSYRLERVEEVRTLCDPRVREAIARAGVQLRSFSEIGARSAGNRVGIPPPRGG